MTHRDFTTQDTSAHTWREEFEYVAMELMRLRAHVDGLNDIDQLDELDDPADAIPLHDMGVFTSSGSANVWLHLSHAMDSDRPLGRLSVLIDEAMRQAWRACNAAYAMTDDGIESGVRSR